MNNPAIASSARRLRLAVLIGIALIVVLYVLGQFLPEFGPVRVESRGKLGGALALLLLVIALGRLAQMLGAIADGPLFGSRVTQGFRSFALWLFLATLADVVAAPAAAIARTIVAGGGHTALHFELRGLLMLAGTLFLFLVARLLEQARAIEAELEAIV
jgi:hypothetical protein